MSYFALGNLLNQGDTKVHGWNKMICNVKPGPNETKVKTHKKWKSEVQIQVNKQNWQTV